MVTSSTNDNPKRSNMPNTIPLSACAMAPNRLSGEGVLILGQPPAVKPSSPANTQAPALSAAAVDAAIGELAAVAAKNQAAKADQEFRLRCALGDGLARIAQA